MSTETCPYEDENMFKGIIAFLSFVAPDSFTIAASNSDENTDPQNIINQDGMYSIWQTDERKREPFFQIDFGDSKVQVTGYSLLSSDNAMDDRDPATWILCGSNDEEEWAILDEQEGTRLIAGPFQKAYIECTNSESNEPFRYIRMQMVEPNHRGDWVFRLAQFELFGTIHNVKTE